mgnify:CR=1 FL=1
MDEIEVFTRGLSPEEINNRVKVFDLCGGLINKYVQMTSDYLVDMVNSEDYLTKVIKTVLKDEKFMKGIDSQEFLAGNYLLIENSKDNERINDAYILSAFSYYHKDAKRIVEFLINYDEVRKSEIRNWLKDESYLKIYNYLLSNLTLKLESYDKDALSYLDSLLELMSLRKNSYAFDEGFPERKLSSEELDNLVEGFFSSLKAPKEWMRNYLYLKKNNLIQDKKPSRKGNGNCYLDKDGLWKIELERTGTIKDFIVFIHEFTHYMSLSGNKDSFFLSELPSMYMESLAASYLESLGYGDNLREEVLRERNNFCLRKYLINRSLYQDLVTFKNNGCIREESSEDKFSGKVKFVRNRGTFNSNDVFLERTKKVLWKGNISKILDTGVNSVHGIAYILGLIITKELMNRPKEEVLPEVFNLIDKIDEYDLERVVNSFGIDILKKDREEKRVLKKK